MEYISKHRWPPVSYLEAIEEYKEKYGSDQDLEGAVAVERGRGKRSQSTTTKHKKTERCSIM